MLTVLSFFYSNKNHFVQAKTYVVSKRRNIFKLILNSTCCGAFERHDRRGIPVGCLLGHRREDCGSSIQAVDVSAQMGHRVIDDRKRYSDRSSSGNQIVRPKRLFGVWRSFSAMFFQYRLISIL